MSVLPERLDLPLPPLVGRAREQAALHEALARAMAGHGSLVLIGGEAGIGKTALAETLCAEAVAQGAQVLIGRCYDLSETPPYGPWREALARSPRGHAEPAPPDLIGGGAGSQAALFAQVHDYLVTLAAQQPLLLLLDDLHWADPTSLDLLRILARDLATLSVLLLVTYRSDELTRRHPLYALLPRLVREAHARRIDLHPLDDVDMRALVGRYALPPADATRLVTYLADRAEGNPFFAGELLRTLEEQHVLSQGDETWGLHNLGAVGVPPLLRQVIDGRLDRLGEAARDVLTAAAVIGQTAPLVVWQAVAEAGEAALLAATEQATEARLLLETPDGAGVCFAHALVREALYEGTLALRRRALHRRVAEALIGLPAPDPDAVAYHFQQAGDPRAGEWLVAAGERARCAYAWFTAAARFEAALALLEARSATELERGWLLYRLAVVRRYTDLHRSLACFDEARQLGERNGEQSLVAYALFEQGMLRCFIGEPELGRQEMAAGADALEALPATEQARVTALLAGLDDPPNALRGTLVLWLATIGSYVEARQMGEALLARVPTYQPIRGAGGSSFADNFFGLLIAYAALGQPDAARQAFMRARALYQAVDHFWLLGNLTYDALLLVTLPYAADNLSERQRLAAEAEQSYRRASGAVLATFPTGIASLPLLALEGRWSEARALADAAQGTDAERWTFALPAWLAREQGNPALAWQLLRAWLPDKESVIPGWRFANATPQCQELGAALALDAGDLPTARAWLAAHDRWLARSGAVLWRAEGQLGWAAYHRAAGDSDQARQHAEAALAYATEPRQPLVLLATYRLLGELATATGDHDAAQAHLSEALALADACAAPYERALCLLALVEWRAATGDRNGAQAVLAEARAILEPLEAKPALVRADALAARLSATAPTVQTAYPAGLSAREVEVLRLVAQGLTDSQVAERLFLSPRTVSTHLRAIYNKLGVDNRTAAARFAVEHDLR